MSMAALLKNSLDIQKNKFNITVLQLRQVTDTMADTMASVTEVQVNQSDSKGYYSFVPWDNPDNVITLETYTTMDNIYVCYLNPLMLIIGVPANVLSCVVFFRQGSGSSFVFIIAIVFLFLSLIPPSMFSLFSPLLFGEGVWGT